MNIKNAFTLCDIAKKIGCLDIDILGGESLLIPWIKDFISYAVSSGFSLNISTNGSFPDVIKRLAEVDSNTLNIGFSLLGFEKTHNRLTMSNNFAKAIEGIKTVRATGKFPLVKSTLTKENSHEILDFVHYLFELDIKKYYLLHEDLIGRKNNFHYFSFPEFLEFYSDIKIRMKDLIEIDFVASSGFCNSKNQSQGRCDAGVTKIAVMPDGSVFPCNLFAGFKDFYLGNIFKEGIEKIWGSKILNFFRNVNIKNVCKNKACIHHLTCRGGCPAHSYFFYGTLDRIDPRCEM